MRGRLGADDVIAALPDVPDRVEEYCGGDEIRFALRPLCDMTALGLR